MKETKKKGLGVVFEDKAAPEPKEPDNTGGKLYRTYSQGYFGVFPIIPQKVMGREADGTEIYNTSIRMKVVRLGIERSTKQAVGIVDTRNLSDYTISSCIAVFGDHWRPEFDKLVERRAKEYGLKEIKSMDEIDIYIRDKDGPAIYASARTMKTMKAIQPQEPEE